MALNNMGPWALVAQYLTNVVIDTIVLFIVGGWYPKWMFSFKRLQLLFGFGVKILGAALLDTAFNELRSIIISARYSTTDLALYDNGRKYPNLIVTNINTSISSVIFPVMSRQQDDKNSIKNMMKKSVKMSTFTIAPLLFGLMAVAERFVEVILTEKWNGCIPYIYITCIMCVFYPIHTINIQALNAVGESAKTLKLEVVKKVLNILILLISMSYGVIGIAVGGMLVSLISTYINAIYSKKMFNYSFVQQIRDILPVIVLSLGMTIIVKIFDRLLVLNSFLMLCLDIIVGGTVYVAGAYIMKLESLEILRSKIKSLKGVHKK